MDKRLEAFGRLLNIMDDLREKCPWDRKQTNETLRHLTIEETYELSDAILENDSDEIKKELGDLFLHLVFYAKIGEEKQQFDVTDVLNSVCEKLIYRHPHIYGDVEVKDDEEVKQNWEQLKLKEGVNKTVLGGVPNSMPSLVKAMRMQDKAAQVGFDWPNKDDVWEKVEEELQEFKEAEDIIHISTVIHVERDSQKGIIIGSKGSALKRVGTLARKDMEAFFEKKVFLQIFVKVNKDWRNKKQQLDRFGYNH